MIRFIGNVLLFNILLYLLLLIYILYAIFILLLRINIKLCVIVFLIPYYFI